MAQSTNTPGDIGALISRFDARHFRNNAGQPNAGAGQQVDGSPDKHIPSPGIPSK